MTFARKIISLICAKLLLSTPVFAEPVVIFAASSLKTALDSVIKEHELEAVPVYGGSAAMARQIARGAEADIVLLAHPVWMDWLVDQNVLVEGSRCNLLGNTLVLAGGAGAPDLELSSADDLINALGAGRLAVGQLKSVPAGQYTQAYLSDKRWLEALRPHLAQTSNVRLALAFVARGEAPFGFVYASDVAAEPRVRTVFRPDPSHYPAIRYPMAITRNAREQTANVVRTLIDAEPVFARNGFARIPSDEQERCQ